MGGVLRCKEEAYCGAAGFPFLQDLEVRKVQRYGVRIAVQIGGVLQYLLDKLYGLEVPKVIKARCAQVRSGETDPVRLKGVSKRDSGIQDTLRSVHVTSSWKAMRPVACVHCCPGWQVGLPLRLNSCWGLISLELRCLESGDLSHGSLAIWIAGESNRAICNLS